MTRPTFAPIKSDLLKKGKTTNPLIEEGQKSDHEKKPEENEHKIMNEYTPKLSVKLDYKRYEAIKLLGVRLRKKSQAIMVEALDEYLKKHGL